MVIFTRSKKRTSFTSRQAGQQVASYYYFCTQPVVCCTPGTYRSLAALQLLLGNLVAYIAAEGISLFGFDSYKFRTLASLIWLLKRRTRKTSTPIPRFAATVLLPKGVRVLLSFRHALDVVSYYTAVESASGLIGRPITDSSASLKPIEFVIKRILRMLKKTYLAMP